MFVFIAALVGVVAIVFVWWLVTMLRSLKRLEPAAERLQSPPPARHVPPRGSGVVPPRGGSGLSPKRDVEEMQRRIDDDSMSLLNPLNPLSPISPLNPLNHVSDPMPSYEPAPAPVDHSPSYDYSSSHDAGHSSYDSGSSHSSYDSGSSGGFDGGSSGGGGDSGSW